MKHYRTLLSAHKKKIIIGAPILFLALMNVTGFTGSGNTFSFSPEQTIFCAVGDEVVVHLDMHTKRPVNAAGGNVYFPPETLESIAVTRAGSRIDLWSEDPVITNESGTIHWSGGIIDPTEEGVEGRVFTMHFRAKEAGKALIVIKDGQLLAHDGAGTNVYSGSPSLSVYVRAPGTPSPDINEDGKLSLSDANTLYLRSFGKHDARNDLNMDGKVGWSDVTFLISLL